MKAKLNGRLSGTDAAFLYLERKEIPLNIAGVCVFDGPIPFGEFVTAIDSKLHLLPRYRQVVAEPPFHIGYPHWEDDPSFDIRNHIFQATLEPPGGQAELEAFSSRLLSRMMDRSRPLWDVHVIDGLADGRGAIIARVHHALADGIAGASLMKIIFDTTPEGSRAVAKKPRYRPKPPAVANHSAVDALASAIHSSLENMVTAEAVLLDMGRALLDQQTQGALRNLLELLPELSASTERFVFNRPCSGDRKFCWTEFSLADAKAIREKAGGTLNDVVLTVVTRAVSRYVKLHGEPVAGRFVRMVCPVSVRRDEEQHDLGNRISFLPVALPLGIADPLRLLHAVSSRMEIMKAAKAAHLVALMASWLGAAPPPLQALFWGTIPTIPLPVPLLNMICTNVPGSPEPLYAAGQRMIASYPHVPTGYELGVNCAVQSYAGNLFCGLTADAHVVPDAEKLRDFIQASFGDLRKAAGVKKSRVPRKAPAAEAGRVHARAAAAQ